MEIKNEHNGIKFGDKCWAWDVVEIAGEEVTFTAHFKGLQFPIKVIRENGNGDEFKFARPLKTEAEKVLEAELKVTFDNMMRYMMFIRDNGYTTEYTKYAKEKGYE